MAKRSYTPEQKLKQSIYDKQYYQDNKEKRLNYSKEYYQNNTEKQKAACKLWGENNKEKVKGYAVKNRLKNRDKYRAGCRICTYRRKYNMTIDEYNEMFDDQKGCCSICGIHKDRLTRALAVDHDHKTNKVRGLLCSYCNSGLGYFKDDINKLKKAIEYLT